MHRMLHRFFCLVVMVACAVCQAPVMAVEMAESSRTTTPIGDKWAVVIGISQFADPSTPPLKYSAKDAEDFYNYLVDPKRGRFAKDHVKLLLNQDATKVNILEVLGGTFLPYAAGPDDLVVIYLSTHGSAADSDIRGVNYVVAHDTQLRHLFATGINLQQLLDTIKERVHTKRILLCLDTCYSGAGGTTGGKGLGRTNVDGTAIAQGIGSLVITSSRPDQQSWESDDLKNSYFTKHLIEALSKSNGMVEVKQAFESMKQQVENDVLHDKGQLQTPTLSGTFDGPGLIVGVPPKILRRAPEVQLLRTANQSGQTIASLTPSINVPNVTESSKMTSAPVSTAPKPFGVDQAKVKTLLGTADAAFDAGEMEKANEYYSKVLEVDPKHVDALANRALARFYLKDITAAIEDASAAINLSPKFGFPYYVRGRCMLVENNFDKAVADFTSCLERTESFKRPYLFRGQAYYKLKKYSEALSDLNLAINVDKANWDARYWRYFTYTALKQLDYARQDAELMVKMKPEWGDSWRCLAYVNEDQNKIPEAIEAYKQAAIKYKAENESNYEKQALDTIAMLQKRLNQPAGTAPAPKLEDTQVKVTMGKADAAFDSGDTKKALELYTQVLEIDPKNPDALANRGLSKFYQKDYIGAFDDATEASKVMPTWGYPFYVRGRCHFVQNDFEKAIAEFTTCLQRQDSKNAWLYRAQAYYKTKDYSKALADLNQLLLKDPDNWDGHYWRYWVNSALKQLDDARVDAELLVKLKPTWGDSHRCLAYVNEDQSRISDAIACYKRAAEAYKGENDPVNEQKMLKNIDALSKK